jgi:hypothetical protein
VLAFSLYLYLPLFFFNVARFLPLALLPRRGVLSELVAGRPVSNPAAPG